MSKLSKSEAEIIEAFEQGIKTAPRGYELAFISGWLKAKHPQLSELIRKIEENHHSQSSAQIAI